LHRTTYGELEQLTHRVAKGFLELGFAPGDGIVLYMPMDLIDLIAICIDPPRSTKCDAWAPKPG